MAQNALPDGPTPPPLHTVPLDAWHRRLGARMVPFAGYAMPVQYGFADELAARCRGGILAEHLHTRAAAGLFDVSHMGQAILSGINAAAALERLVPGDIIGLKAGRQRYTLLTNEAGGIIDDIMVTRLGPDRLFVVVNASRRETDLAHLTSNLGADVQIRALENYALLALQGPAAVAVVRRLAPAVAELPFMGTGAFPIDGIECLISRSGYTGEDGFEISVPAEYAEGLANQLLENEEVAPMGLGARDSLRLEAGLCLYGNDIDELTSPVEAGLTWVIGKRRKMDWAFPGGLLIRDQIDNGVSRRRVGIRPTGRTPARAQTLVVAEDGTEAGFVTSGGFGPTVNGPIAMGYVRKDLASDGTQVQLVVRGKMIPATVVPLPFVPHRYAR